MVAPGKNPTGGGRRRPRASRRQSTFLRGVSSRRSGPSRSNRRQRRETARRGGDPCRDLQSRAMANRDEILAYAAELLDLDAFPDYGPMGMQVVGAPTVTRIACGVSASRELFRRAAELGAE